MPRPGAERLRVALFVGGFPTAEEPNRCVFNLRAAERLGALADVEVLFHRAWRPGRPRARRLIVGRAEVLQVASPQVPGATSLNLAVARRALWPLVARSLRAADVVHSVNAAGPAIVAAALARRARTPHVAQVIGSDVNSVLPARRDRWPFAGWARGLAGAACNSEALRGAFRALYPAVRNVRTVYRGADLERFTPRGPRLGPQAEGRPVRFLYLGGLPAYPELPHGDNTKGGRTLMAAWRAAESAPAMAAATLVFAGPATPCAALEAWRRGLSRPGAVLTPGAAPPDQVAGWLRAADVVLVPSLEEGLPNVAVEASGCGRAVIGAEVGGVGEVVVDGETGRLLPPGDERIWRDALVWAAERPGELETMGCAARARAEARFDAARYAPAMLDLYRIALGRPAGEALECAG